MFMPYVKRHQHATRAEHHTTVDTHLHKNKTNVALNLAKYIDATRHQHATRANQNINGWIIFNTKMVQSTTIYQKCELQYTDWSMNIKWSKRPSI